MIAKIITFVFILTPFSAFAANQHTVYLTEISGFAKAPVYGIHDTADLLVKQGKLRPKIRDCLKNSVKEEDFNQIYADKFDQELSTEEVNLAIAFFSSSAGKKYTDYGFIKARKQLGKLAKTALPEFTQVESTELIEFSKTNVGAKIMLQGIMNSDSANKKVKVISDAAYSNCQKKHPA